MSYMTNIAYTVRQETERLLITRVEEIEGRVPTNQEIATFGARAIHPDGTEVWKWRDETILVVKPPTFRQ